MNNLKKTLAILLSALLCVAGLALAEEAETAKINTLIVDGEFVIQIDVEEGDMSWLAYDMEQDSSVVELAIADTIEDTFVARYTPVGDGDVTVGVRHYSGHACDQLMTWDLRVEDGAVKEVIGGSHTMAPADEDIDPHMIGQWLEQDTQFTTMTVEKNPERGWDLVIVSPVSHGAYVFKTSVLYDCDRDCFTYDKGKFWDIDGEYEEGVELGEARTAGTTGSFAFIGDEENPSLEWHDDDENPEGSIVFERVETEE